MLQLLTVTSLLYKLHCLQTSSTILLNDAARSNNCVYLVLDIDLKLLINMKQIMKPNNTGNYSTVIKLNILAGYSSQISVQGCIQEEVVEVTTPALFQHEWG